MATDVAKGSVLLTPRFDSLTSSLESAFSGCSAVAASAGESAADSFASAMTASSVIAEAITSVVSSAMSTISSSISSAVSNLDTINNYALVMANLGYATEEAEESITKISSSLDGLPTSTATIVSYVQQLAAYTDTLDEATSLSLALNNAMLSSGASSAEAESAMTQFVQCIAAGSFDAVAWNTITYTGSVAMTALAKTLLGTEATMDELKDALDDGTISMDDFLDAIIEMNEEGTESYQTFYDMALDAQGGIGTAITNFGNRVTKGVMAIIDALNGEEGRLAYVINQAGYLARAALYEVADVVEVVVEGISDFATAAYEAVDDSGVLTQFKNTWSQVKATARGVANELSDFVGSLDLVGPSAEDVVDAFESLYDAFVVVCEYVNDGLYTARLCIRKFVEVLSDPPEEFAAAMESLSASLGTVCDAAGDLKDYAVSRITAFLDSLDPNDVAGEFGEKLEGVCSVLASLFGVIDECAQGAGELLGGFVAYLEDFPEEVTTAYSNFTSVVGTLFDIISCQAGAAASAFLEFVASLVEPDEDFDLWQAVTDVLTSLFNTLTTTAVKAGTAFCDFLAYVDDPPDELVTAWSNFTSVVGTLFDIISCQAAYAGECIAGFIADATGGVDAEGLSAWDVLTSALTSLFNLLTGVAIKAGEALCEFISFVRAPKETAISAFETLGDNLSGLFETISGHASSAAERLGEFIDSVIPPDSAAGEALASLEETLSGLFGTVKSLAGDAASAVGSFIESVKSPDASAIDGFELLDSALSTLFTLVETKATIAEGLLNSFVELVESPDPEVTEAFTALGGSLTTLYDAIVELVDTAGAKLAEFLAGDLSPDDETLSAWDMLSAATSNIATAFAALAESAGGVVSDLTTWLSETDFAALEGYEDAAAAVEGMFEALENPDIDLNEIAEVLISLISSAASLATTIVENADTIVTVASAASDIVAGLASALETLTSGGGLAAAFSDLCSGIYQAVYELAGVLDSWLNTDIQGTIYDFLLACDADYEWFAELTGAAAEACGGSGEYIVETSRSVASRGTAIAEAAAEDAAKTLGALCVEAVELCDGLGVDVLGIIGDLGIDLSSLTEETYTGIIELVGENYDAWETDTSAAAEAISAYLSGSMSEASESVAESAESISETITAELSESAESAAASAASISESLSTELSDASASVSESMDEITSSTEAGTGDMTVIAITDLSTLSEDWEEGWGDVRAILSDCINQIVYVTEATMDYLVEDFGGMVDSIAAYFSNSSTMLYSSGAAIVTGLYNGMKTKWKTVSAWLSSLADEIADLKGPLDYDKTVLEPAGNALMEGLNEGLEDGYKDVAAYMADVTNDFEAMEFQANYDYAMDGEGPMSADDVAAAIVAAFAQMGGFGVTLDGDALVGELAPQMNREMGRLAYRGMI